MRKLTASNLVNFIAQLDKSVNYNYIHKRNASLIEIIGVDYPEGPVQIKRWNPKKGEKPSQKEIESISSEMIWRAANAFSSQQPMNLDRVLGGSYNTRSVLESLLAHTPQFYVTYPGRVEQKGSHTEIKKGHKHLVWRPEDPHKAGRIKHFETNKTVSEIPFQQAVYESLSIDIANRPNDISEDELRRHAQIQMALFEIGQQLNFQTWIALNDQSIEYKSKKIIEYHGVVKSLSDMKLMKAFDEATKAALMIDCIWFKNGKLMPAVMEIEHSTGVTSGLTRMKNFDDLFIKVPTRYVIVAPDEIRDKVFREGSKLQFQSLRPKYFPYSAVEELLALCQRRKLRGVTEEFLDCYMEPILEN